MRLSLESLPVRPVRLLTAAVLLQAKWTSTALSHHASGACQTTLTMVCQCDHLVGWVVTIGSAITPIGPLFHGPLTFRAKICGSIGRSRVPVFAGSFLVVRIRIRGS